MHTPLDQAALDQLFLTARTHNAWQPQPVPDELLHRLYNMFRMGPTSANCSPARIAFVKSKEAKEKLQPALAEGNRAKTMVAPVTAIIGYDMKFYEKVEFLFPHAKDVRSWFDSDEQTTFTHAHKMFLEQSKTSMLLSKILPTRLRKFIQARRKRTIS